MIRFLSLIYEISLPRSNYLIFDQMILINLTIQANRESSYN